MLQFCGYFVKNPVVSQFTFVPQILSFMRGQRIFNELIKGHGLGSPIQKGRSNKLVNRRNECLLARYYYHGYYKNLCYEEILRQLVTEFFLSPRTVANIILDHSEQLQALKQRAHVMYYFQSRWPHMRW